MRHAERAAGHLLLVLLTMAGATAALPAAIQQRIAALPAAPRQALRVRQATLDAMTDAQRRAFARRIAAWDALPIPMRRERRERWQAWLALPLEQQLQVRSAAAAYAVLPAVQQQVLRQRFEALDGSQRHGWLLGPALGADYTALQPLLAQVPATQRDRLLAVLRAMAPNERIDLGVLAQRTPPQQRDALRRALLSTSIENRGAWLRLRLDQ